MKGIEAERWKSVLTACDGVMALEWEQNFEYPVKRCGKRMVVGKAVYLALCGEAEPGLMVMMVGLEASIAS